MGPKYILRETEAEVKRGAIFPTDLPDWMRECACNGPGRVGVAGGDKG